MEIILLLILIVLLLIYKEIKALNVFQIVETDTFISNVKQLTMPIVIEHKLKFNCTAQYWYSVKYDNLCFKTKLSKQLALPDNVVLMKAKSKWAY
ncbi:hypothetical protein KO527_13825 [Pseudoalteromonas sp. C2R02]|uniref:hypothetical protein n=1 Tax=Pseudoalteromonas sp. C2R02 TaxID=2841565 RepID=UPI001C0A5875|nr:hypothetical protein [Pseudoalteromonas sp. C2R02]MBU2970427.1 hypothetical protein [Pseudoalteromonas sp. C2R02]